MDLLRASWNGGNDGKIMGKSIRADAGQLIWSPVPRARDESTALQDQFYRQIGKGAAQRWPQTNFVSQWPTCLFQIRWSCREGGLLAWLGFQSWPQQKGTLWCVPPNTAHPWAGKTASFLGFGAFRFMKIKLTHYQDKYCELWTVCSFMFECCGLAQYLSGMEARKQEGEKKKCW